MKLLILFALVVVAAAVVILVCRGLSFRAQLERDIETRLVRGAVSATVVDGDLASLPPIVQRYLRLAGVVGQPRVWNFRARFRGRIRSGPDARWMSFTGEQYNFYGAPSRFFLMEASMFGLPVQAFHRYVGASATMRVKVASLVSIVDASGAEMDQAETVTLLNDMCVFAPAALIDAPIQWKEIDVRTVAATYTNGGHTVTAVLRFNDTGELVDFVSDDRFVSASNGQRFKRMRWSTPLRDYRSYGSFRLASRGKGLWHAPASAYVYISLELDSLEYNVTSRGATKTIDVMRNAPATKTGPRQGLPHTGLRGSRTQVGSIPDARQVARR
jgi:hypothetical protein